jgi:hypothetical protein
MLEQIRFEFAQAFNPIQSNRIWDCLERRHPMLGAMPMQRRAVRSASRQGEGRSQAAMIQLDGGLAPEETAATNESITGHLESE